MNRACIDKCEVSDDPPVLPSDSYLVGKGCAWTTVTKGAKLNYRNFVSYIETVVSQRSSEESELICLDVKSGEIVAFVGANGAGKKTLLRTISGLLRPRSGTIQFEGRDITREPPHLIAQSGLAQVPEGRLIQRRMTARDNLLLDADIRTRPQDAESVEAVLGTQVFRFFRARNNEQYREDRLCQFLSIGRGQVPQHRSRSRRGLRVRRGLGPDARQDVHRGHPQRAAENDPQPICWFLAPRGGSLSPAALATHSHRQRKLTFQRALPMNHVPQRLHHFLMIISTPRP